MDSTSTSDSPAVAVIGASLWGNRGAEAMMCATLGRVRSAYPAARCIILSYFPAADRRLVAAAKGGVEVHSATPLALVTLFFPFSIVCGLFQVLGLRWPRRWLPAPVRALAECDVLLDIFGVSYADGREKFLPFNVLSNLPALLMGVPVVKLSQGMGPFRGVLNRTCAKAMLRRCVKVFARGRLTYELTEGLGLDRMLDRASDTAFVYEAADTLTAENDDYVDEVVARLDALKRAHVPIFTLSVSSVVYGKCRASTIDYVCAMQDVVRAVRRRGMAVVLFPNATREGLESTRNNDLPVIAAIMSGLDPEDSGVVAVSRDVNTKGLRRILAPSDYLVASRFHAMVAGLAAGIPTMVLGWGHKYREVLDEFGLGDWAWDYSQLDAARLMERIDEFTAVAPELRAKINAAREFVVTSARRQFDWLQDFLGSCRSQNESASS